MSQPSGSSLAQELLDLCEKAEMPPWPLGICPSSTASLLVFIVSNLPTVVTALEDSVRLETYLMGACNREDTSRDQILAMELRKINGPEPTLAEWREAIDAARKTEVQF